MWAFEVLGLSEGAGEREVKRAYAKLLKLNRPDENLEKFQELHQAYQMALSISRFRMNGGASSELESDMMQPQDSSAESLPLMDEAVMNNMTVPLTQLESEPDKSNLFDQDAFMQECIAQALASTPEVLQAWLEDRHELWSLQRKSELGQVLVLRLNQDRPPLSPDVFRVLIYFFGLDRVQSHQGFIWMMYLERRIRLAWELQPENWQQLGERLEQTLPAERVMSLQHVLEQLCRPFDYWRAMGSLLMPWRPSELRKILVHLDEGRVDDLPPPINPEQVSFWMQAGDRSRFSWPRLQVGLCRALVVFLSCFLLLMVSGLNMFYVTLAAVGISFGAWLLYLSGQGTLVWQRRPETEPDFRPLLRLAWVPILFLSGILLCLLLPDRPLWGYGVCAFASITAFFRYLGRNKFTGWFSDQEEGMHIFWVTVTLAFLFIAGQRVSVYVISVLGMGFWLWDAWKQRSAIRGWFKTQLVQSDKV